MLRKRLVFLVLLILGAVSLSLLAVRTFSGGFGAAGGFGVAGTLPAPRSLDAPTDTAVTIQFSQPISPGTVFSGTMGVFGRWSGPKSGSFGFRDGDMTVVFTPTTSFSAGEPVMVALSDGIQAADGTPLPAGFSFQFWTQAAASSMQFETIDVLDVRYPSGPHTQAYGGVATDFNGDGWLDLSIVNEISADVRVFLNRADGTGLYQDFLQPPTPVNTQASPSEPADFNMDGRADLAVVNIATDSVSVLLGNGDGTFAPQQEITVGSQPRGIAVLDADGDGDPDIVNTNSGGAGSLSLLLNNGSGVFGAPTYFEGGADTEWALGAGDMNEDGILDLVIGARETGNPQIIIQTGNGDGTFSFASSRNAGGRPWMLNVGDVNGDGHDDAATVNSDNSTGSILLGNGSAQLGAPMLIPLDPFPLATDLGDIDGDGDLDWATSSYSGDWLLFLNNGQGQFLLARRFEPTSAASCALMLDADNNGTLDLALIDEIADEVILVQNGLPAAEPQIDIMPAFLTTTVPASTTVNLTATVANQGLGELAWELHESSCTEPADIPWLTAVPLSGTISGIGNTAVAVTLSADGLAAGVYAGQLCFASNDAAGSPWLLPVSLRVTPAPEPPPPLWWRYLPLILRP